MSQHRLARCLGLAGSIMIAVTAFFGGALPAMGDDPTPVGLWRSDGGPAAIGLWFAGLAALGGAWWMLRRGVPSLRWAYVTIAQGAALALAVTVALSPVFHPWYALWPLVLLAVTVRDRIGWFTGVALGASFLVFANGVALARHTKIPGAPLMTLAVIAVTVHLVSAARRGAAVAADPAPRTVEDPVA